MPLDRRDILKYTALLTGYAVSAPLATALLTGCDTAPEPAPSDKPEGTSELKFFTPDDMPYVRLMADTILPATDSPSATEVGVDRVLDRMLGDVFDAEYQRAMRGNWRALRSLLEQADFLDMPQESRAELLLPARHLDGPAGMAYRDLRQQIVAYYLTSEQIGEQFLNYLPIPGEYQPCISIDEVNNKAWAII